MFKAMLDMYKEQAALALIAKRKPDMVSDYSKYSMHDVTLIDVCQLPHVYTFKFSFDIASRSMARATCRTLIGRFYCAEWNRQWFQEKEVRMMESTIEFSGTKVGYKIKCARIERPEPELAVRILDIMQQKQKEEYKRHCDQFAEMRDKLKEDNVRKYKKTPKEPKPKTVSNVLAWRSLVHWLQQRLPF